LVTQTLNDNLVAKARNIRKKQESKQLGQARVLTVEEAPRTEEERAQQEQAKMEAKERYAALCGSIY
jgi:hypothetical protein